MARPLTRADVVRIRADHTGRGLPAVCKACPSLTFAPCAVHQLAEAALRSPEFEEEEIA